MNKSQRNFGLDIIRSIAILMVVIAHFCIVPIAFLQTDHSSVSWSIVYILGIAGVELFFVLSGFLIGKILVNLFSKENYISKIKTFYFRRWFRTLPLYYLFLLIHIFILKFIVLNGSSSSTLKYLFIPTDSSIQIFKDFSFLSKYLFFLQNFDPRIYSFYFISWTLTIEEWFYLLIPLFLAVLHLKKIESKKLYINLIKLIIFIGFIRIWFILLTGSSFEAIREFIPLRFDSLLTGVLFACLKINNKEIYNKLLKPKVVIISFIMLISVFICLGYNIINQSLENFYFKILFWSILPFVLGFLIIFFESNHFINTKLSSIKIIKNFFEKTSVYAYSMYLCNFLIVVFYIPIYVKNPFLAIFLGMFTIYFTCAVLYKYYEKPIMDLRENFD